MKEQILIEHTIGEFLFHLLGVFFFEVNVHVDVLCETIARKKRQKRKHIER